MTIKLITGAAAINKAIDSIASRGKKLDKDIWIAALSCIQHHSDHGDVTLFNRLVDSMPKGSRVNALRDWAECYSGMAFNAESKTFLHSKGKPVDMEGAMEKPWYDFRPENPSVFNAEKAIAALVRKALKADPSKGDSITDVQVQAIRELAAKCGVAV